MRLNPYPEGVSICIENCRIRQDTSRQNHISKEIIMASKLGFGLILLLLGLTVDGLSLFANSNQQKRQAKSGSRVRRSAVGGNGADITSFHVDSRITTRYARVAVSIVVENTSPSASLISMKMRLPKTAFMSNFSMEIDETVYVGVVKAKTVAKQQFQRAVSQGQSTGLLSTTVRETQSFDVSVNVAGGESVTFRLNYEELLKRKLGAYNHVIYADLGQTVNNYRVDVLITEPSGLVSVDASVPGRKNGEKSDKLAISVRQSSTQAYITYSPTAEQQAKLNGDSVITVSYDVTREKAGGQQLITRDGYFIHWFAPSNLPVISKNVVFIFDKSGSMAGNPIAQAKEALSNILDDLAPGDKFNIITFASTVNVWKSGQMMDANSDNIALAKVYVSKINSDGLTAFYEALLNGIFLLDAVLPSNDQSMRVNTMIVLTDGQPTAGAITDTNAIRSAITKRMNGRYSLFCLGFGARIDQRFLKKLAEANKGISRQIYAHSDAALQVKGFYDEVASPLLTQLTIQYKGCKVEKITKHRFDHYFHGSEVLIGGKFVGTDNCGMLNLTGHVDGQSRNGAVSMETKGKDLESGFADESYDMEKIWAYLTIQHLLDRKKSGTDKHNHEILSLSLKYNFVTEMTSMVVTKPGVGTSSEDDWTERRSYRPSTGGRIVGGSSYTRTGPSNYGSSLNYQRSYGSGISGRSYVLGGSPLAAATSYPRQQNLAGPRSRLPSIYGNRTSFWNIISRLPPSLQVHYLGLFGVYSSTTTTPATTTTTTTTTPATTTTTTTSTTSQVDNQTTASTVSTSATVLSNFSEKCGSHIEIVNETVLTSPHYPGLYPPSSYCQWNVTRGPTSANQTMLQIAFTAMDLESDPTCSHDKVTVYPDFDGANPDSNPQTFCGFNLTSTVVTARDQLLVVFQSDDVVQGRGFTAKLNVL